MFDVHTFLIHLKQLPKANINIYTVEVIDSCQIICKTYNTRQQKIFCQYAYNDNFIIEGEKIGAKIVSSEISYTTIHL